MHEFLNILYGDAVAEHRRLAIFTLPDRRTRFFSSLKAASLYAGEQSKTQDVYLCVGLAGADCKGKPSASEIVAIAGFWADIDMPAPWREHKSLPPTIEDAQAILGNLPFPPSLIVDSGHGLHAWWLLKEPWTFDTAEERLAAAQSAKGWVNLIQDTARNMGWEVDPVGDLARILRLPGTWNRKGPDPVEVRVVEHHEDRRYNPDDFAPFAAEDVVMEGAPTACGDLVLRVDAEPPAEKFAVLMQACPAFLQAWNRQRPDLEDQSQSAYDLSLADIAALNGWSDQEIADLIIATRRKHDEKPDKALRADYVTRTIASARRAAEERIASGVNLSGFKVTNLPATPAKSLGQIVAAYPALRPPIIEGLLREGETMNVISAPKIGKSWLVIDLALSVATGRPWLGMDCVPGDVLILDNELHGETSANRIPKVAIARGIPFEDVADRIFVENLRGRLQDLFALGPYFRQYQPGRFKVVILDAFYRFLPIRADENDNGTMASLYNYLDSFADYLKCSFVLIHHTSKGNQSLKDITDVGAGAGAQSRATDTHLILRKHQDDDVVVLDAAVRSWPPVPPRCLRWAFPVWLPADDLSPAALKKEGGKRSAKHDNDEPAPSWTVSSFVDAFIGAEPKSQVRILEETEQAGLSSRKVKRFLDLAEEDGTIFRSSIGPRKTLAFATTEPPDDEIESSTQKVAALLQENPGLSTKEVAEQCGLSERRVQQIRKELKAKSGAKSDAK